MCACDSSLLGWIVEGGFFLLRCVCTYSMCVCLRSFVGSVSVCPSFLSLFVACVCVLVGPTLGGPALGLQGFLQPASTINAESCAVWRCMRVRVTDELLFTVWYMYRRRPRE